MSRKIKSKRILFTMLSLLCMLVIFLFSAQTASESSGVSDFVARLLCIKANGSVSVSEKALIFGLSIRKLGHITEYFILGLFVYQAVKAWGCKLKLYIWPMVSLIICYIYAVSDEFHQSFVPDRGPSFRDTLIDSIGIVAAIIISLLFFSKQPEQPVQGEQKS